jgi:hypothetical protein
MRAMNTWRHDERPAWCPPHIWNDPSVVRTRKLAAAFSDLLAGKTPTLELEPTPTPPPDRQRPIPGLLAPAGRPTIRRRHGLHPNRFRRLIREHDRLCHRLEALPTIRTWPRMRARLETQFRNRIVRIRRQLGLRAAESPRRQWYRIAAAAAFLGVCPKTLVRWEQAGRITSRRSDFLRGHRYFRDADLRRLRAKLKD